MKEQDYIQIMNRISKNKIEEAFSWNASAQKNRRSIRRLSMGVGAIAAAIAVVIGCIGYNYRDRLHANPGDESSDTTGGQRNLLGGHGEIKGFVSSSGIQLFRDDDCYYMQKNAGAESTQTGTEIRQYEYCKWTVGGSSAAETITCETNLLTDGEQVYICQDHQIFVTDGNGNHIFFSAAPWESCRIQKLCEGWYFLSALVEDSWIDGEAKPYVFLNKNGDGICNHVDYGDVRSDGRGNTIYFRKENQIYAAPWGAPDHEYLLADAGEEPDCLVDWTVDGDNLYYISAANGKETYHTKTLHPDAPEETWECAMTDDPDPLNHLWDYEYFNKQKSELFTATYTYRDGVLEFHVTASGTPIFPPYASSEGYFYSVTAAELWGDDLPDTAERPFMEFFDTGDHIVFTLPKEGKNGEQIVQLNKQTGEYLYFGENYAPEQPKTAEQSVHAQQSAEVVPEADSGFCSPDVFSLYYIPEEHFDASHIECCRMLPAVKASESRFDADVLSKTLPQGGGFIPNPNEKPHISFEEAKDIILGSDDPNDTSAIYLKFSNAANGYAGKYPYESINKVCYEFWLNDNGSEFIVAFCSYENEQETIEYVYFRYDASVGQYAYQYITKPTNDNTAAEGSTETNVLGGKGKLRLFRGINGNCLSAEDDTYFYDLYYSMRARKNIGDTEFEKFTLPGQPETNSEQRLYLTDGMNLVSMDDVLYEINPDGSLSEVLKLTKDQNGKPIENPDFDAVIGMARDASGRPTVLFLAGSADRISENDNPPEYYEFAAFLNLKTGKVSYMKQYSSPATMRVIVSENAVYAADTASLDYNPKELLKYSADGSFVTIDTSGWDFTGIILSLSEDNESIYFFNKQKQYCKGNMKDGSCTILTDITELLPDDFTPGIIPGTQKFVCTVDDWKRVILSNPDGSDQIILNECGNSAMLIVRSMYVENDVIHLNVAEMLPPSPDSPESSEIDHVLTIDGDTVSSYTISVPT